MCIRERSRKEEVVSNALRLAKNQGLALPTARILLIVAVAVGILVVAGSAFQVHGRILDGEATVYVDPADQRVSRGDPFTVAIAVKDLSNPCTGTSSR
jgi:hypothetical protein